MGRKEDTINAEHIGAELRRMRQDKGISLTEMATLSGYSKGYLSGIEHGDHKPTQEVQLVYERELGKESETNKERLQKKPFNETRLFKPDYFVGRNEDLVWLLERLKSDSGSNIAALYGLGGIGKTSLAAIATRKLRKDGFFSDGIAVVECENLKTPAQVIQQVFSLFGFEYYRATPDDFTDIWEISKHLFDNKKILIVLDDIQPELAFKLGEVVAPLRSAEAALLLTSRQMLPYTSVPVDATRRLDLLSWEEAFDLFIHLLGIRNITHLSEAERESVERIIKALDRHTLAVELAGIYLFRKFLDLDKLADDLEGPIGAFRLPKDEEPQALKYILKRSLEALPAHAQYLFAALGSFAQTDFSLNAAIALAKGLDLPMPEELLDILGFRNLVSAYVDEDLPRGAGDRNRLRLHALLRVLAISEFEDWPEEKRHSAFHALVNYYAEYANRLQALDSNEIVTALKPDKMNVTQALEWAHKHGQDSQVMLICSGMQHIWYIHSDTDTSLQYLPWGIDATNATDDTSGNAKNALYLAELLLSYGNVLQFTYRADSDQGLKHLEKAQHCYEQSLQIARQVSDKKLEGVGLYNAGRLARKLGNRGKAEQLYREALSILQEAQNLPGQGWTLAFLGQIREDQGDLEGAEQLYLKALDIHRRAGHRRGEGWCLGYLGRLALTRRKLEKAKEYYEDYLKIAEPLHDRRSVGVCYSFLGEIALYEKEYDKAEERLQKALDIMCKIHDVQNEGWINNLLGQVARARGEISRAEMYLQEALFKLRAVNDLRGENLVNSQLAEIRR